MLTQIAWAFTCFGCEVFGDTPETDKIESTFSVYGHIPKNALMDSEQTCFQDFSNPF